MNNLIKSNKEALIKKIACDMKKDVANDSLEDITKFVESFWAEIGDVLPGELVAAVAKDRLSQEMNCFDSYSLNLNLGESHSLRMDYDTKARKLITDFFKMKDDEKLFTFATFNDSVTNSGFNYSPGRNLFELRIDWTKNLKCEDIKRAVLFE